MSGIELRDSYIQKASQIWAAKEQASEKRLEDLTALLLEVGTTYESSKEWEHYICAASYIMGCTLDIYEKEGFQNVPELARILASHVATLLGMFDKMLSAPLPLKHKLLVESLPYFSSMKDQDREQLKIFEEQALRLLCWNPLLIGAEYTLALENASLRRQQLEMTPQTLNKLSQHHTPWSQHHTFWIIAWLESGQDSYFPNPASLSNAMFLKAREAGETFNHLNKDVDYEDSRHETAHYALNFHRRYEMLVGFTGDRQKLQLEGPRLEVEKFAKIYPDLIHNYAHNVCYFSERIMAITKLLLVRRVSPEFAVKELEACWQDISETPMMDRAKSELLTLNAISIIDCILFAKTALLDSKKIQQYADQYKFGYTALQAYYGFHMGQLFDLYFKEELLILEQLHKYHPTLNIHSTKQAWGEAQASQTQPSFVLPFLQHAEGSGAAAQNAASEKIASDDEETFDSDCFVQ